MSDRVIRFKCPSKSCRGLTEADQSAWELQLPEVRELFRTCRQIHNEAKKIFYEVNSWSLSRAKLGVNPKDPAAILHDTNIMFHRLRHIGGTKNFRHINMRIYLSDRALCDLGVPTTIDMDDTRAVLLYQMNQDPVHIGKHILSEGEQCELYRVALKGLADNRLRNFPNLRSLTLQVALHSKKRYSISNDPLNCCGLTFYVTVQFGYMEAPHIHREYVQQRGVPSDNYTIPPDENLSMYQPTRWLGNSGYTWGPEYPNIWDPRRRMLAPLAGLRDIRNIEGTYLSDVSNLPVA